jgi:hypothetical protein
MRAREFLRFLQLQGVSDKASARRAEIDSGVASNITASLAKAIPDLADIGIKGALLVDSAIQESTSAKNNPLLQLQGPGLSSDFTSPPINLPTEDPAARDRRLYTKFKPVQSVEVQPPALQTTLPAVTPPVMKQVGEPVKPVIELSPPPPVPASEKRKPVKPPIELTPEDRGGNTRPELRSQVPLSTSPIHRLLRDMGLDYDKSSIQEDGPVIQASVVAPTSTESSPPASTHSSSEKRSDERLPPTLQVGEEGLEGVKDVEFTKPTPVETVSIADGPRKFTRNKVITDVRDTDLEATKIIKEIDSLFTPRKYAVSAEDLADLQMSKSGIPPGNFLYDNYRGKLVDSIKELRKKDEKEQLEKSLVQYKLKADARNDVFDGFGKQAALIKALADARGATKENQGKELDAIKKAQDIVNNSIQEDEARFAVSKNQVVPLAQKIYDSLPDAVKVVVKPEQLMAQINVAGGPKKTPVKVDEDLAGLDAIKNQIDETKKLIVNAKDDDFEAVGFIYRKMAEGLDSAGLLKDDPVLAEKFYLQDKLAAKMSMLLSQYQFITSGKAVTEAEREVLKGQITSQWGSRRLVASRLKNLEDMVTAQSQALNVRFKGQGYDIWGQ